MTVKRIETSGLFWKDLAELRRHPHYWTMRANIAEVVKLAVEGDAPKDVVFSGAKKRWENIRHAKLGAKLTLFTVRDNPNILCLAAIKKHDFYGFRKERSSMADNAAMKIRNTHAAGHVSRPEWDSIKWTDPTQLIGHPEIREMSEAGLRALYQEILDEDESLERYEAFSKSHTKIMRDSILNTWIEGLDAAVDVVEAEIMRRIRRPEPNLSPEVFEDWSISLG